MNKIELDFLNIFQEIIGANKYFDYSEVKNFSLKEKQAFLFVKKINKKFKVNISLRDFLKEPIIKNAYRLAENEFVKRQLKLAKTKKYIKKASFKKYYRASYAQKRFWILYKMNPNSSAYNINQVLEFSGELDVNIFESSFKKIIERHEVFRTNFLEFKDEIVQKIESTKKHLRETKGRYIKFFDARSEKREKIKQRIDKIIDKSFDLEKDNLFRITILRTEKKKYFIIIVFHHIIMDIQSIKIFYNELFYIYRLLSKKGKNNLPPHEIHYKDYAEWEYSVVNQKTIRKQKKYWKEEFNFENNNLNLPIDKSRPSTQTYNGSSEKIVINKRITEKLKKIAKENNTTLFVVFFAIFNIMLHRIVSQKNFIIGTLKINRNFPELNNSIGYYANNLAIKSNIIKSDNYLDYLKRFNNTILLAIENSNFPFEKLIDMLEIERDQSRPPLFNVLFRIMNYDQKKYKGKKSFTIRGVLNKKTKTHFDLMPTVIELPKGDLLFNLIYNTDLFNQETIERFLVILKTLIQNITNNPKQKINDLEIIPKQERQKLLYTFNNTNKEYPKNKTIQELFEEQAEKTPKRIAVEFKDKTLTYEELNKKANQLANYLKKEEKVKKGDILALISERNPESIIAIFAILKAGATYLPIDPAYPQDRIEYMLNQSKAKLLLSAIDKKSKVYAILNKLSNKKSSNNDVGDIKKRGDSRRLRIIDINKRFINSIDISEKYIEKGKEADLAYVIYTSGSTGNPKGVKIEHRAILNTLYWLQDYFKLTKNDVIAQKTALSFTDSVWEIFWPLINGAKLSIFSDNIVKDPKLFIKNLKEKKISYTQFVPALMTVFLEYGKSGYYIDNKVNNVKAETIKNKGNKKERKEGETNTILPNLKYIFNGGEALPPSLANKWYKTFSNVKIANIYGMTESAIYATNYIVPKESDENQISVPLGKPIANEKVHILDNNDKICPLNIPGQIAISGKSLASGYLHNKEITKKSFIKSKQTKEILYKTGDLGKIDYNFNLHYLGRTDHQVKVRGYRVELGEIESIIRKRKDISQCAVIHKKNKQNSDDLYAFYIAKKEIDSDIIKDYIKKYLPNYMVPSFVIYLEEFPLNVHGKIDRKELHKHKIEPKLKNNYQKPEGEIEKRLAKIWREVLGIKRVSRNDNFFNLGGHSLSAIDMLHRINKDLRVEIFLENIFNNLELYKLAKVIENKILKISLK
jgi:amino acid adenylation domain-containing protein